MCERSRIRGLCRSVSRFRQQRRQRDLAGAGSAGSEGVAAGDFGGAWKLPEATIQRGLHADRGAEGYDGNMTATLAIDLPTCLTFQ